MNGVFFVSACGQPEVRVGRVKDDVHASACRCEDAPRSACYCDATLGAPEREALALRRKRVEFKRVDGRLELQLVGDHRRCRGCPLGPFGVEHKGITKVHLPRRCLPRELPSLVAECLLDGHRCTALWTRHKERTVRVICVRANREHLGVLDICELKTVHVLDSCLAREDFVELVLAQRLVHRVRL